MCYLGTKFIGSQFGKAFVSTLKKALVWREENNQLRLYISILKK